MNTKTKLLNKIDFNKVKTISTTVMDYVFLLCYFTYIVLHFGAYLVFKDAIFTLPVVIKYIIVSIALFIAIAKIILNCKSNWKYSAISAGLLAILILFLLFKPNGYVHFIAYDYVLYSAIIFIIAAYQIPFDNLCKVNIISFSILLFTKIVGSLLGIMPTLIKDGMNSLGTGSHNTTMVMFLCLTLVIIYYFRDKKALPIITLAILAINIALFSITKSKSSFVIIIYLCLMVWLFYFLKTDKCPAIISKILNIIKRLMSLSPVISFILTLIGVITVNIIGNKNPKSNILDITFVSRFNQFSLDCAFHGIRLPFQFHIVDPADIHSFNWLFGDTSLSIYHDNIYHDLFISYSFIILFLFIALLQYIGSYAYKHDNHTLLIVLSGICLLGLMENAPRNMFWDLFLLFPFAKDDGISSDIESSSQRKATEFINRIIFLIIAIITLIVSTLFVANRFVIKDLDKIKNTLSSLNTTVYVTDNPLMFKYHFGHNNDIEYLTRDASSFADYDAATIIVPLSEDVTALYDNDFQSTMLSDDYQIYTNDENVIATLSTLGYEFHRYYSYDFNVNLEELAKENNLTISKDNSIVLYNTSEAITTGPAKSVSAGYYTVKYSLFVNEDTIPENDFKICTLTVAESTYKEVIKDLVITRRMLLDGDGVFTLNIALYEPSTLDFFVKPLSNCSIEVRKISIEKDVQEIVIQDYDSLNRPIRQYKYKPNGNPITRDTGIFITEYAYDEYNRVISEKYYDLNGNPICTSDNYFEIRTSYYYDTWIAYDYRYYGIDGSPVTVKSGYHRQEILYDQGRPTGNRFLDENDAPVMTKWGYSSEVIDYDDNLFTKSFSYYDENGNPVLLPMGYHRYTAQYDSSFNILLGESYYDINNAPIAILDGQASVQYVLDDWNRITEIQYYGTDGEPTLYKHQYAILKQTYDENGNISKKSYYGLDKKLTEIASSQAIEEYSYDSNGNIICVKYYNSSKKPVLYDGAYQEKYTNYDSNNKLINEYYMADKGGINQDTGEAMVEYYYDVKGNLTSKKYYNEELLPTMYDGIYATICWEYDDDENQTCEYYLDTEGNLCALPNNIAKEIREYDNRGNLISCIYRNADDEPTPTTSGYGLVQYTYDDMNRNTSISYYTLQGAPINIDANYHKIEYSYNDNNEIAEETYYNKDGGAVNNSEGIFKIVYTYDNNSNIVSAKGYDINGTPVNNEDGYFYSACTYNAENTLIQESYYDTNEIITSTKEYDYFGNIIKESFFDSEGNPLPQEGGESTIEYKYNNLNLLSQVSYLDGNGNPIMRDDSYSYIQYTYNDRRLISREEYFDNKENKACRKDGVSSIEYEYDKHKNNTKINYFNALDKPVLKDGEYASVSFQYDFYNRVIREDYFDANDNPIALPSGEASVEYQYDSLGNISDIKYYGTNGQPVLYNNEYYEISKMYYTNSDLVEAEMYRDQNGELMRLSGGQAAVKYTYYANNKTLSSIEYFNENYEPIKLNGYYARIDYTYNDDGSVNWEYYFDENGNPTENENGVTEYQHNYE